MGYHPPLVYYWKAFYHDGTELAQFDDEGNEHLFKEIDQSKLKGFGWFPFTYQQEAFLKSKGHNVRALPLPSYVLWLKPGQRLIAFRRHFLSLSIQTPVGVSSLTNHKILYVLGWQETIGGRNMQTLMYIDEEGNVELSSSHETARKEPV